MRTVYRKSLVFRGGSERMTLPDSTVATVLPGTPWGWSLSAGAAEGNGEPNYTPTGGLAIYRQLDSDPVGKVWAYYNGSWTALT